jgi:hypothetical protein
MKRKPVEFLENLVEIKPDKCLFPGIRELFLGKEDGDNKRIARYYPDEVFMASDEGQSIFFVPVIALENDEPERCPIPIFMCKFSRIQKLDIIAYGNNVGLKIEPWHFNKPKISILYK